MYFVVLSVFSRLLLYCLLSFCSVLSYSVLSYLVLSCPDFILISTLLLCPAVEVTVSKF